MKNLGLIPRLLLGLAIGILVGLFAPEWIIRFTETGRIILGNLIKYFIPLIIVFFVAAGIAEFGGKAGKILSFTVGISYIDTVIACILGATVAYLLIPGIALHVQDAKEALEIGKPFLELQMPPLMDVMTALILAFLLGIGCTWGGKENNPLYNLILQMRGIIDRVIRGLIIPLVPIFVGCIFAGIAAKGQLFGTMAVFAKMLAIILILHFVWLAIEFFIAGIISRQNPLTVIAAMIPAYLTAMGTMSSAATMPVSLKSAKSVPFIKDEIADFVMPLCSTVHLSGAAMTITISAITVSLLTLGQLPPVSVMITFILLLGVIEVGAVGVPGGSAMAALGILQSTLGFNEAALGLMLTLFMVQDSFGTAANITGDGAIAMIVNKYFGDDEKIGDMQTENYTIKG